MVEVAAVVPYLFGASLIFYIFIVFRNKSNNRTEDIALENLEKVAQYVVSTGSIQNAFQQLVAERPASTQGYAEVLKKINEGQEADAALAQVAKETKDDFFSKVCIMLISIYKKNDPNLLYESVQKMKEASELNKTINKSSEVGSWMLQFVFAILMPTIYFFMASILGFETDVYISGFLGFAAIATALSQGIVFKQWIEGVIKVPLLFSLFYLIYFILLPRFFGELFSGGFF